MPQVQPEVPGAGLSLELLVTSLSKFLLPNSALLRERQSRRSRKGGATAVDTTLPPQPSGFPHSQRLPQALTQARGGGGKL